MRVDILGRRWNVSVLDADAFRKRFNEDLAGVTLTQTNEIVINREDLTLATVKHECWHGLLAGMCISAADLSLDQFEEVTAEVFAIHGDALSALASKLHKALLRS